MYHTLNKRDRYETSFNDQEEVPEKLQKRNRNKPKKSSISANARRRETLKWPNPVNSPISSVGLHAILKKNTNNITALNASSESALLSVDRREGVRYKNWALLIKLGLI